MSNIYTSNWTPERVEQMTMLWSDGFSAGMIAKELGAFESTPDGGRNSVIGKLYRLGLVGSGIMPRYTLPRKKGHRAVNSEASRARRLVDRFKPRRRPLRGIVVAEPLEAPQLLGKTLLELHAGECKWPAGDGPYTFCANPVRPASVYCAWHCSIAYTKDQRTQTDFDRIASRAMGSIRGYNKSTIMEA